MSVFTKRLKEARTAAGYSQEKLGILAGIEEASASARMNQYERGKHQPDYSVVEKIAKILDVPEAYFYAKEDDLAELILAYYKSNAKQKKQLFSLVKQA
jgi:transcriptional regulator with XRE-family HTH domain|tara:strand:+ start:60 stop:356 length:297 start_codon:yes stop_codon:yes gene_type:complete